DGPRRDGDLRDRPFTVGAPSGIGDPDVGGVGGNGTGRVERRAVDLGDCTGSGVDLTDRPDARGTTILVSHPNVGAARGDGDGVIERGIVELGYHVGGRVDLTDRP